VIDRRIPVRALNYLWHRAEWPPIEILAGPCDVVHAAHPLLIPAKRAAQVVTIHDLFFLSHPERTRAEVRRDYAELAAKHARRADAVITPSDHTRQLIVEKLGVPFERIHLCPPGAPTWSSLGKVPNVPSDGCILFIGTLEPRKNVGTLLDAYARLAGSGRSVPRLVLAGASTPDASEWLNRIERPPLKDLVSYVGYVRDDQRERLFAGARALVMPSLDEGFGLPVLEAMSAGVPVIASDGGALPEVVSTGGTIVGATDVAGWVTAIERVASDREWAAAQGRAGLDRAKQFTWGAAAKAVREAYIAARTRRDARGA
jgi:glycosyltransferase involved in cell wall biosynthesis